MIKQVVLAALVALASAAALAQDFVGTITILEGTALVYRGAGRVHAAEGIRIVSTDLVEMGASGFMQIELPDKTTLQLGPRSRAMFSASPARAKPERSIYALDGWFKVAADRRDAKAGPGLELRSALIDVPAQDGALVIKIAATDVAAFAEVAESKLLERHGAGPPVQVTLKLGDFYQRKGAAKGAIDPGARGPFLSEMPAVFKDSLPSRIERYREKPFTPKEASEFSYADVEHWLKSGPALRKQFVQRWRAKAAEPTFRTALMANLNAHPEWDPVLFPEKYVAKPVDPPAETQQSGTSRVIPANPSPRPLSPAPVQSLPPPTQ